MCREVVRVGAALRLVAVFVMASVVGVVSSPLHQPSRQILRIPEISVNSADYTVEAEEHQQIRAALSFQRWLDVQPDVPVWITIPSIGLDTSIEEVGLTANGAVDVPKDPANVAWFNGTVVPGWPGASLVDGHYDTATGPAALYNLKLVKSGAVIVVLDASGQSWQFVVDGISSITIVQNDQLQDTLPASLFVTSGPRTITVTTCYGQWNSQFETYDQRLLVHATLSS